MNAVGIDRVTLKGLNIERVDVDLLKARGFTVVQDGERSIRLLSGANGTSQVINYIKVSSKRDNNLVINELRIGRKEVRINDRIDGIDYEHLDVTLPKALNARKTNEENISNTIDLLKALEVVEAEIEALGFGKVDLLNAELKELEVNTNIDLKNKFNEYEKPITYIQEIIPRRLKIRENSKHKPGERFTGFKSSNGSVGVKFYDKRQNLKVKYGVDIGKERLRVEYSFLSERKIKDIFKSNILREVIEGEFEGVQGAFKRLIKTEILERVDKDIKDQVKRTRAEIKRSRSNGRVMVGDYLLKSDVIDILIILRAMKDEIRPSNYARQCRNIIDKAVEMEKWDLLENLNKLNEIIEGLGGKPIEIKTTKGVQEYLEKTIENNHLYKRL